MFVFLIIHVFRVKKKKKIETVLYINSGHAFCDAPCKNRRIGGLIGNQFRRVQPLEEYYNNLRDKSCNFSRKLCN